MAKYLSNLLQDNYTSLGLAVEPFLATGGTVTTIINSEIQYRDEQPDEADFETRRYWAFIHSDAGGAGAAPELEYRRVSGYASDTWTYTVAPAFTAAPASGDRVLIVGDDELPLEQSIIIANQTLLDFGRINLVDTSLTTGSSQTEYTLPAGITRENLSGVWVQKYTDDANDNQYYPIRVVDIRPATAGSQHTLVLEQLSSGYTLLIRYQDYHPTLTAYNSPIAESLPYRTVKAAMQAMSVSWLNNNQQGTNEYFVALDRKSAAGLDQAKAEHPLPRKRRRNPLTTLAGLGTKSYPGDQSIYDR